MVGQAGFFYKTPKSLDELTERASDLRDARDIVREEFGDSIRCDLSEDKDNYELYAELEELSGDKKLDQVLYRYLSLTGLPESFINHSDWKCVNNVLSRLFEKTTKRILLGFFSGKRVVDLK